MQSKLKQMPQSSREQRYHRFISNNYTENKQSFCFPSPITPLSPRARGGSASMINNFSGFGPCTSFNSRVSISRLGDRIYAAPSRCQSSSGCPYLLDLYHYRVSAMAARPRRPQSQAQGLAQPHTHILSQAQPESSCLSYNSEDVQSKHNASKSHCSIPRGQRFDLSSLGHVGLGASSGLPLIMSNGCTVNLSSPTVAWHQLSGARGFRSQSRGSKPEEDFDREFSQELSQIPEPGSSPTEEHAGWMIRLANENGYLSWMRNSCIAVVVAVTIHTQMNAVPYAQEAAFAMILLGFTSLACGTGSFLYNLVHLRHKMHMSSLTVVYNLAMAVVNLLLWLGAMALFMGYVDEEDEEEQLEEWGREENPPTKGRSKSSHKRV